jgi:hypothetical protein
MTIPTPVLQFRYVTQEASAFNNPEYSCRRNAPADTWFKNLDSTNSLSLGKDGGDPFCFAYLKEDVVTSGNYTNEFSGTYELKEYYTCDEGEGKKEVEAESDFKVTAAAFQCTTDADGDGEPDVQPSDIVYSCNSKVERGDRFGVDRATGELKANPLCSSCPDSSEGPDCELKTGLTLEGICVAPSTETKKITLYDPIPPVNLQKVEYPDWNEATTENIGAYYFSQAGKSLIKDYRRIQFRVSVSPPPPLCYVKIWFIVKVTRYKSRITSGTATAYDPRICDPTDPFATKEGPFYHYYEREFNVSGNPAYSEIKGNPCINNLDMSMCHPENIYFSEPIEVLLAGGDEVSATPYDEGSEGALHSEGVSNGEGAVIEVMIRKFSYVKDYEPEDPSELFPFDRINTETRSKLDGFFTPELEADTRTFINEVTGNVEPLPFK